MSTIAIKDLKEDTTLDQAAMSELRGGKGGGYPTGKPHGNQPRSDDRVREQRFFYLTPEIEPINKDFIGVDDGCATCAPAIPDKW